MSDKEQDKDPGFGYREILTVFLAVAITAIATRAVTVADRAAEFCRAQLLEIILFCIFYTVFRIKWYLDDVRVKEITLPDKKEINRLRSQKHNGFSICVLPFAMASWVFWLLAAFSVPDNMCWAYLFLVIGVGLGTVAASPFGELQEDSPCPLVMMNIFYIGFLIAAGFAMDKDLEKNILLSLMIVLSVVEALDEGSFLVKIEKQNDRNNPPGETLHQKKE